MTSDSDREAAIQAPFDRSEPLVAEFDRIRGSVETISAWRPWSAYTRLSTAARERVDVDTKAKALYAEFRSELSQTTIVLPAAMVSASVAAGFQATQQLIELVRANQVAGRNTLAMLRLGEASQSVGAVLERKYAYAFGFISLYAAIVSVVLGAIGAYPVLS